MIAAILTMGLTLAGGILLCAWQEHRAALRQEALNRKLRGY